MNGSRTPKRPGIHHRALATFGLLCVATFSNLLVASAERASMAPRAARSRPNLLLISIDTLRADRVSALGYTRPTTPALERFAADGVVFERFFYSGGGTLPSHLTMLTSLYPGTHGIGPQAQARLPEARITLADTLRAAGYRTAALVDGGWMSARFGFDQGFDLFDETGGKLASILPKASAWLDREDGRPFFLFLHTYDVHSSWNRLPYDCPGDAELFFVAQAPPTFDGCRNGICASELLKELNVAIRRGAQLDQFLSPSELRFIGDLYDGCIRYVDGELERFFGDLRSRGLWTNTLVIVTSDHGEELGEHGMLLHDDGGWEELARIPLLLKLPHARLAGTRVQELATMVDLMPTVLDLLDLETPAEAQGRTLLPAMTAHRAVREDVHMYSVLRTAQFKYFSDERRLFDLLQDPAESENLWAVRPNDAARLERRVRTLIAEDQALAAVFQRSAGPQEDVRLTKEQVRQLRALGYLR